MNVVRTIFAALSLPFHGLCASMHLPGFLPGQASIPADAPSRCSGELGAGLAWNEWPRCRMSLLYAAGLLAVVVSGVAAASNEGLVLGRDYYMVKSAPTEPVSGEVIEVFSYSCDHCAEFEPFMRDLQRRVPSSTTVTLMPVVFRPGWEATARAFYAAQSLGVLGVTHDRLFDAIHKDHQSASSIEVLAKQFYADFGVKPDQFVAVAKSSATSEALHRDYALMSAFAIDRTPTLIVNRKYRVVVDESKGLTSAKAVEVVLKLLQ